MFRFLEIFAKKKQKLGKLPDEKRFEGTSPEILKTQIVQKVVDNFIKVATERHRIKEVDESPFFPYDWREVIQKVAEDTWEFIAPLVAKYVYETETRYPNHYKYCPIRSGELYYAVAKIFGFQKWISSEYPLVIRNFNANLIVYDANNQVWSLDNRIKHWYYQNEASKLIRRSDIPIVVVDWGYGGSIPDALNRVRNIATQIKYSHSANIPATRKVESYFLFSAKNGACCALINDMPCPEELNELESSMSIEGQYGKMNGLLTLAEVMHDRLRGLSAMRPSEEQDYGFNRQEHPNSVIWALNWITRQIIFEWLEINKATVKDLNVNELVDRAVGWTNSFTIDDFEIFTLRSWKKEIEHISLE